MNLIMVHFVHFGVPKIHLKRQIELLVTNHQTNCNAFIK